MLHAPSPPRGEAASTPLPRRTTLKKAVTSTFLQFAREFLQLNAVTRSDTLLPVFVLRIPALKMMYLRQAETVRLNAYRSAYTRSATCATPPSCAAPPLQNHKNPTNNKASPKRRRRLKDQPEQVHHTHKHVLLMRESLHESLRISILYEFRPHIGSTQ
jgi:hypothetical protein